MRSEGPRSSRLKLGVGFLEREQRAPCQQIESPMSDVQVSMRSGAEHRPFNYFTWPFLNRKQNVILD